MRTRIVFLIFSLVLLSKGYSQSQNIFSPYIENYTTKNYNGQPDNFAGIEDNRGFMYFGNLWGILEFDGNSWRNIYFPNGSSGISFAKNDKGIIYCGGRGELGLLSKDSTGFLQYSSLLHLLKREVNFNEIWSIFCIDSSVVFCSHEAIFILKNNAIKVIEPKTAFERAFLAHGKIFLREQGQGILQLLNNQLVLVDGGDFFAKVPISIILPNSNGNLIIANNSGIFLMDGTSIKPWNVEISKYIKDTKLFTATPLSDSSFMLATNTKGLIIINNKGEILHIFNQNKGLLSNEILNSFCDSKGNIWVMSRRGISKIEFNNCFNYINSHNGISGLNYTSCIYNETLYLGTSVGLFYQKLMSIERELSGNKKFKLLPTTEGIVWTLQKFGDEMFCGHDEGVYVLNNKQLYNIPNTIGVWCFLQPKGFKDIILAGTYTGIMVLKKVDQTWRMNGYLKGFNESSRYLIQDEMEDFWVSHGNKGVFKLSLSHNFDTVLKINSYGPSQGLESTVSSTVYKHNNDIIVTNNNGFYKYDYRKDHFEAWNELNSLLGEYYNIQKFVVESDSSFWIIATDEKIWHISKSYRNELKADITIRKFRNSLAGSFEHILPINEGTTVFATLDGYAFFDKEKCERKINYNTTHFNAFIRKFELTRNVPPTIVPINNHIESQELINATEIKHKQNSVKFSFSSNCFEDIELIQYQYFLKGYDQTWSSWMNLNHKEYTNLSPGKYEFIVHAKDSYNTISKTDSFEFIILPPWYRSTYAYTAYVLLVIISFYCLYKFILFRLKIQKRRLELKKKRELWALNKKHKDEQLKKENEILKLNNEKLSAEVASHEQQEQLRKKDKQIKAEQEKAEQELSKYEKEKHELEIAHKRKELSIMAMQIVQKKESISKIRKYLEKYTEENSSDEIKAMASNLFKFINEDSQRDKEWDEFQEYFNLVHSSFLNRLKVAHPDISPTLLKLCAYLRVKMSNKQIARLMNKTPESVIKSRYRLRKILQLSSDDSLDEFMENF